MDSGRISAHTLTISEVQAFQQVGESFTKNKEAHKYIALNADNTLRVTENKKEALPFEKVSIEISKILSNTSISVENKKAVLNGFNRIAEGFSEKTDNIGFFGRLILGTEKIRQRRDLKENADKIIQDYNNNQSKIFKEQLERQLNSLNPPSTPPTSSADSILPLKTSSTSEDPVKPPPLPASATTFLEKLKNNWPANKIVEKFIKDSKMSVEEWDHIIHFADQLPVSSLSMANDIIACFEAIQKRSPEEMQEIVKNFNSHPLIKDKTPRKLDIYQALIFTFLKIEDPIQLKTGYDPLGSYKLSDARREKVREGIFSDNHREAIVQLTEAAKLTFTGLDKNSPEFKKLADSMASGSNTATQSDEKDKAKSNIKNALVLILDEAFQNKPLSLAFIAKVNHEFTSGTKNNGASPGQFREDGVEVKCPEGIYISGIHVAEEMGKLCEWINEELKSCGNDKEKVIEIAARAYSWSVSIHPFMDGNGRTCRAIANHILITHELPPAIFDEKTTQAAVFGAISSEGNSASQESVLKNMVDGMIAAHKLLEQ